jgi:hypothetical protein
MLSSSDVNAINALSPSLGQRNRPFSSLLKWSQNPSPSHSSILRRSRFWCRCGGYAACGFLCSRCSQVTRAHQDATHLDRQIGGLLQNTNSSSPNGSSLKLPSTMAMRPLMLFLMSVCPQARYTVFSPNRIIVLSASGRSASVAPGLWLPSHLLGNR